AVVAGRRRTIALRYVGPGRSRAQAPENPVQHLAIIHPWLAARLVRQQRLNDRPFKISDLVAASTHHISSFEELESHHPEPRYQFMSLRPSLAAIRFFHLASQLADKFPEVAGFPEITVDRSEADVGDLVESRERIHHHLTDHLARNLGVTGALQSPDNAVHDALEAFLVDGALLRGDLHGAEQLVTVEGLALAIRLYDRQFSELHPFEGGEARAAVRAMSAPPYR